MSETDKFLYAELSTILRKYPDVAGVSVGLVKDYDILACSAGYARLSTYEILSPEHYMQCASLSKTIASVFAFEYFSKRSISMSYGVNDLLEQNGASWRIEVSPELGLPSSFADSVSLAMLLNHTSLGMHYVYGIPLKDDFPPVEKLIDGYYENIYRYQKLYLERIPGEKFAYSGGGFLVMQYLLETISGQPIEELMRPFLDELDLNEMTFSHSNVEGVQYAYGHLNRHREVQPNDCGRFAFPPLAAGALCTPRALASFLSHLSKAYIDPQLLYVRMYVCMYVSLFIIEFITIMQNNRLE